MNKYFLSLSIILFLFFTRCSVVTVNEYETLPPDDELSEFMCIYSYLEESYFSGCT